MRVPLLFMSEKRLQQLIRRELLEHEFRNHQARQFAAGYLRKEEKRR